MPCIEIYAAGCRISGDAACAATMEATSDDGRVHSFQFVKKIGDHTKNRADIVSVILALRSIKPEFKDWKIVLHTPPGYASQSLEKNDENEWLSSPKANVEIINEARTIFESFKNISIKAVVNKYEKLYSKCLELAKNA